MLETLRPRSAVTALPPPRGVRLSEIGSVGKIDLRGDPADRAFMGAIGRALDLLLPTEPCQSATQGEVTAMWVGPDQWLVACPKPGLEETLAKLGEAVLGIHASVTDVSDGRAVFRLAGPERPRCAGERLPARSPPTGRQTRLCSGLSPRQDHRFAPFSRCRCR